MKEEDKTKFGLQEQRHLRGSVQCRCAEVYVGCDGIWDSFRATHGWGCYKPSFSQDLLPGESSFLCSLFAVHTNHRISRFIYLFIVQLELRV